MPPEHVLHDKLDCAAAMATSILESVKASRGLPSAIRRQHVKRVPCMQSLAR